VGCICWNPVPTYAISEALMAFGNVHELRDFMFLGMWEAFFNRGRGVQSQKSHYTKCQLLIQYQGPACICIPIKTSHRFLIRTNYFQQLHHTSPLLSQCCCNSITVVVDPIGLLHTNCHHFNKVLCIYINIYIHQNKKQKCYIKLK